MIYLGIDGSISRVRLEGLRVAPVLYSIFRQLPLSYFDTFTHIALDSGAYPAWKEGKTVDFSYYKDMALRWHYQQPWEWIASDMAVDEPFDQMLDNCNKLRSMGLPAVPAYKQGSPLWQLEFLRDNFDHIGIGSTDSDTGGEHTRRWLDEVFDYVCDSEGYSTVKVHGFRLVSYYSDFPFYSCDSTTWAQRTLPDLRKRIPWAKESELMPHVISYYTRKEPCARLAKADQMQFALAS